MRKNISIALLQLFFSAAILLSCKKGKADRPVELTTIDTTITDSTIFIDITLDGVRTLGLQNKQPDNIYGPWGLIWNRNFIDTGLYAYNFPGVGFEKSSGGLYFNFAKGNIYLRGAPPSLTPPQPYLSYRIVDNFFAPGKYGYASLGKDTSYTLTGAPGQVFTKKALSSGIHLSWIDDKGILWQTSSGSGDQSGSSFSIIKNQVTGDPLKDFATGTVITASFNCKLYDKSGRVKALTNGRFRLGMWL